jgi:hypothetical protein
MSPIAVIILIIVILVVIAAAAWGVQASRRKKLQSTFGPEYDRVVADTGSRSDGEKELREREKRHAELELKPLSAESQAQYAAAWEEVQIQFVDVPEQAVTTADDLVTRLIAERGYPTGDYDDQLANLSVEHARTLGHYRDAHEISLRSQKDEASTEDLRQALVHYRALFADLLGTDPIKTDTTTGTPIPVTPLENTTTTGTPTVDTAADTDDAQTERAQTDRADAVPAPGTAEADTRTTSTTSTPINDTDVAGTRPDATTR